MQFKIGVFYKTYGNHCLCRFVIEIDAGFCKKHKVIKKSKNKNHKIMEMIVLQG